MIFDRLFKRLFVGAGHVPALYPDLDPRELERFLTDRAYTLIKSFDNVYVLPFISRESKRDQLCFGIGLSQLMIRNLMLLRDVSIHGPEDTPEVPFEAIHDLTAARPGSCQVTGVAKAGADGYSLRVEVHRPRRPVNAGRVHQKDFKAFLGECTSTIGTLLASKVDERCTAAWSVGQPRDAKSLIELGALRLDFERGQLVERARAAQQLLDSDPGFAVPTWQIDEEVRGTRQKMLAGLKRDPYNAQLYFLTFLTIWNSQGPQPEALQFCRKAIELSPGHGKAHMPPHAAQRPAEMWRHAELGYRLLPGNSFAVNNYTIALTRANAPAEKLIELAEEGIAADPRDPSSHYRLIEAYAAADDHRAALAAALRLQQLFIPEIDERALYCLRQNPATAKMLDSGQFDPAADNRRRIAILRAKVEDEEEEH